MVVTPRENEEIGFGFGESNSSKMRGGAGAFADRSFARRPEKQKPRLGRRRGFFGEAKQLRGSTRFRGMSEEAEKGSK
jgi:hypothetical protein